VSDDDRSYFTGTTESRKGTAVVRMCLSCSYVFVMHNVLFVVCQWQIHKFWKGGRRHCISPDVIYCKCTQWTICILYGKMRLTETKLWGQ